jgi:hypothetical protein
MLPRKSEIQDRAMSDVLQPATTEIHAPRPTFFRTLLVIMMLCLWEGFPLGPLGLNTLLGYQAYGVITVCGGFIYGLSRLFRNRALDVWSLGALGLFAWCCVVSVNYSVFSVPQPIIQWLPAFYTVTPVLTVLLFNGLRVTLADAQRALFWTGFFAALLIVVEGLLHTGLLSFYARGSAFGSGKIVFFKLVCAFALMIALVQAVEARTPGRMLFNMFAAGLNGYNSIFLAESRIISVACILAAALTWLFVLRGTRKFLTGLIAPLVVIPVGWLIAAKYFSNFSSINDYLANDVSSNWRRITMEHYAGYFNSTNGMGFGFMSGNPTYDNVIAFSTTRASELYGVKDYAVGLDDIGLGSALYQYGYFGLILILLMTIVCIFTLALAHRVRPDYAPVSALGILMGTLMISPVSMNYFTLFYTAHIGGLLWFMAGQVGRRSRVSPSLIPGKLRRPSSRTAYPREAPTT